MQIINIYICTSAKVISNRGCPTRDEQIMFHLWSETWLSENYWYSCNLLTRHLINRLGVLHRLVHNIVEVNKVFMAPLSTISDICVTSDTW